MMKIATQTFGLRQELNEDLLGTIDKIHSVGFDAIEPFILFNEKQGSRDKNLWAYNTLELAVKRMNSLGMTIPSAHIGVGFGMIAMPINMIMENIVRIHEIYGIDSFVISGTFCTVRQTKHWAKLASKISDAARAYGCKILYHNHDDEFQKVRYKGDIITAMDIFLEETDPDVQLQLDIGWAGLVEDECSLLHHLSRRIASIHLKDFYPNYMEGYNRKTMPAEAFAPIGEGAIRINKIISMLGEMPSLGGTVIIDQDKYIGDMINSLGKGCINVRKMMGEQI